MYQILRYYKSHNLSVNNLYKMKKKQCSYLINTMTNKMLLN